MATSTAKTVDDYLASLPVERRKELEAVRKIVLKRLPKGYEEGMGFGMISYSVPKARLAETYNGHPLMYAALAVQKNYCAVYLMGLYGDGTNAKQFTEAFRKAGKKLDMGKSCVRFRTAGDLALDAVGDAIASLGVDEYVAIYEKSRLQTKAGQKKAAKKAVKK